MSAPPTRPTATRRAVVRAGARLAYAAPLVAASAPLVSAAADCECGFGAVEVMRRTSVRYGQCATCPPGYHYRAGQEDCKKGRLRVAATFGAKTCLSH